MTPQEPFEIYLVATPGLEAPLLAEARSAGFDARPADGGVTLRGGWPEVWRANLEIRGATRVLLRIGAFRAMHLAQLDKRARKFPWATFLRPDVPLRVEATCGASRIYHAGAARQRVERAIAEEFGAPIGPEAGLVVKVRIEDDLCTLSVDTTGDSLHKRGHKFAVGKAPMRETMAAMFLRECGYDGDVPVLDPMCGSGTFVIEAAEIALGMQPGRSRSFAFEALAGFDRDGWQRFRAERTPAPGSSGLRFRGSDRDRGAVEMSRANALRAGVQAHVDFRHAAISDLAAPEGPAGLVIVNPPYGARIGDKKPLIALHGTLGRVLREQFTGWRVGLITSDVTLARATGLPFAPPGPYVAHGGLKIRLYQTGPLG